MFVYECIFIYLNALMLPLASPACIVLSFNSYSLLVNMGRGYSMSSLQWIIIAIVCGAIEIFSAGFWFLWLAIAAFLTAIGARFGWLAVIETQLLAFAFFSLLLVIFTRPLALRFFKTNDRVSNVAALIGQHGIAITDLVPLNYGQVKVNGEIWTAISDQEIKAGTRIQVMSIDGVKLQVEKAD
jgi:membrane protein implicated in regulation of membrane protease activity